MYVMESPEIFEPVPVSVLRRRHVNPSEEPDAEADTTSESELSTAEAPTSEDSDGETGTETEAEESEESDVSEESDLLEAGAVGIQGPEDFLNFHFRIGGGIVSVCHTLIMFVALIVYMWIIAYQFEQMKKCRCD